MIILDTNVLSEAMKPRPASEVVRWLDSRPEPELFLTSVTQAEILYGIEILARGRRRTALESAIEAIFEEDFFGRILPFDTDAARVFPKIVARRRASGRPIGQFDAQIAAIAHSRGAAVATRNDADFENCGIAVLNPWTGR